MATDSIDIYKPEASASVTDTYKSTSSRVSSDTSSLSCFPEEPNFPATPNPEVPKDGELPKELGNILKNLGLIICDSEGSEENNVINSSPLISTPISVRTLLPQRTFPVSSGVVFVQKVDVSDCARQHIDLTNPVKRKLNGESLFFGSQLNATGIDSSVNQSRNLVSSTPQVVAQLGLTQEALASVAAMSGLIVKKPQEFTSKLKLKEKSLHEVFIEHLEREQREREQKERKYKEQEQKTSDS